MAAPARGPARVPALVADLSLPRAAWVRAAGHRRPSAGWSRGGVLRHRQIPLPELPGRDGWVRVRPVLAGVCGSDLKVLHAALSPVLTAWSPNRTAVLGHEVTGVVTEVGRGVTRVAEGDSVLVEPTVRCVQKGITPQCTRCAAGEDHLCEHLADAGDLCTGQGIGFSPSMGGGWAGALVAHQDMLHTTTAPPERAVLAEPAAVALHAALRWDRRGESGGDAVAVIGPGSIGLLVTAALRRLHPDLDITMVCAGAFGADRAVRAGATRAVQQPAATALEAIAGVVGARRLRPRFGGLPVLDRGLDAVFDCVASAGTLTLATHALRSRGTLVVVGTTGPVRLDWSPVWFRELTVRGTICYADEPALGGRRTFAQVGEWLADPGWAGGDLVTHTYPLAEYAAALETATAGPAAGAVKVVLAP